MITEAEITRKMPSAEETERAVLGCCLLDPEERLMQARSQLTPEHFYFADTRIIFETLCAMADQARPIDPNTLQRRLFDDRKMEEVGGAATVLELFNLVPNAAHLGDYIETLREKYAMRTAIRECEKIISECYGEGEGDRTWQQIIADAHGKFFALLQTRQPIRYVPSTKLLPDVIDAFQQAVDKRGHVVRGVATGFTDLDRITGGLRPEQLMIIGGRPAMGKSAIGMNIAENIALAEGHYDEFNQDPVPVGFVTVEMSAVEQLERMAYSRAFISLKKRLTGFISHEEQATFALITTQIGAAPLWWLDRPRLTIQELQVLTRQAVAQHGLQVLVVDYLQKLKSSSRAAQTSRQIEVAEVASGLKEIAKELKIVVIAMAQINREAETNRKDGKPTIANLRDSGDIEQDADIVGLLWRKSYYDDKAPKDEAELIIAKHRNGPIAEIKLTFEGVRTRFNSTVFKLNSNDPAEHQLAV